MIKQHVFGQSYLITFAYHNAKRVKKKTLGTRVEPEFLICHCVHSVCVERFPVKQKRCITSINPWQIHRATHCFLTIFILTV